MSASEDRRDVLATESKPMKEWVWGTPATFLDSLIEMGWRGPTSPDALPGKDEK